MSRTRSLKWLLSAVSGLDNNNSKSTSILEHNFTFTADNAVADSITIDASRDVSPVTEDTQRDLVIESSLDYLFVSSTVEQPFQFLKPPQENVSPIILSFSWRDRNTYLSTKMVYSYFPRCTQFFLCKINNFISKGNFIRDLLY